MKTFQYWGVTVYQKPGNVSRSCRMVVCLTRDVYSRHVVSRLAFSPSFKALLFKLCTIKWYWIALLLCPLDWRATAISELHSGPAFKGYCIAPCFIIPISPPPPTSTSPSARPSLILVPLVFGGLWTIYYHPEVMAWLLVGHATVHLVLSRLDFRHNSSLSVLRSPDLRSTCHVGTTCFSSHVLSTCWNSCILNVGLKRGSWVAVCRRDTGS